MFARLASLSGSRANTHTTDQCQFKRLADFHDENTVSVIWDLPVTIQAGEGTVCRRVGKPEAESILHYSYLSVSIGSKRAAFNAGYILNKTPHAIEKEIMIIMLLTSTTVGISLK